MAKIRILIADDHELVRNGIGNLLSSTKDFEIVGEASDGKEAVEKTAKLKPDVLIIDLSMPVLNGIEATRLIKKKNEGVKVLVLTMHENEEYLFQILSSGASGYILKNAGKDELIAAVRAVQRGEKFFSTRISEMMVQGYMRKAEGREKIPVRVDLPLTKRELEVLRLVAEGRSNQQIADTLFISPRTVETHRTNIMQKLNIHDVVNLVRYAIEKKIIEK